MQASKFKSGQLVKYKVHEQWRYNFVVDGYYNDDLEVWMYRLFEIAARPVYREDWLEAVDDKELKKLRELAQAGKMARHKTGCLVVKESEEDHGK